MIMWTKEKCRCGAIEEDECACAARESPVHPVMEPAEIIETLRFAANVAENNDKPGIGTVCRNAAEEIELLQQQVALLREALALHHSMVLGGEKESPASEACKIAMESSR